LDVGRWAVAARRLEPILAVDDATPGGRGETDGGHARGPAVGVVFDGVTVVEPGAEVARLSDITMTLKPGSTTALVGPSGAGKSTLIALAAGTLRPTGGAVRFIGEDDTPACPRIGWLGQRTELFRGPVAENLRLARFDADDESLRAALIKARLWDALGPDGLGRRLGDEGSGLSGGERRRLALARTMLQDPELVLVDEPTEGLDEATAAEVFDTLLAWADGRTLVFATHRPREAARADRVLTIVDGRLAKDAAPHLIA
ncbi:MAG TPA: ATP-binding cassette domain-containing protein, partial [Methylomirabilota bacterium]|nr:ATP-binding cassette domain-containing protein [Methylomirabilota bacterium]